MGVCICRADERRGDPSGLYGSETVTAAGRTRTLTVDSLCVTPFPLPTSPPTPLFLHSEASGVGSVTQVCGTRSAEIR